MNKNVFSYCSAMAQARRLMCDGIITAKDYEEIDTILLQKYNLQLSSLYRDRDLIIAAVEGNIPHYKEEDLWAESVAFHGYLSKSNLALQPEIR